MNIAFLGLGKLGFPCAVALAMRGHDVYGYDTDQALIDGYRAGRVTPFEPGLEAQYASAKDRLHFAASVEEAVGAADIIFTAVPTPHAERYDGSHPYDGTPRDFDRAPLRRSLEQIGRAIAANRADGRERTVLIISTVTPGSTADDLAPTIARAAGSDVGDGWSLVYNPFFIGQSTVVSDFLNPEFVLLGLPPAGRGRDRGYRAAAELYRGLHDAPLRPMTWTEAECVKLCYNTYLGLKVLFANAVMELCHTLPDADCDVVNGTLKLATDRLVSTKYMDGGMADGGPCHGRDQMAMSFAARKHGIGFNVFDVINNGRDRQTDWLAGLVEAELDRMPAGAPVVQLGIAFKPGTNQTQGSPALLLRSMLERRGITPIMHDPALAPDAVLPREPAVYVVSTNWPEYREMIFKAGDVVIDPWRMIPKRPGVRVIGVGRSAGTVPAEPAEITTRPVGFTAPRSPSVIPTRAAG